MDRRGSAIARKGWTEGVELSFLKTSFRIEDEVNYLLEGANGANLSVYLSK